MKFHIKKGDDVTIIAGEGREKGKVKVHRVIEVDRQNQRVYLDGANLKSKHTKPNAKNPQGGIVKSPGGIHISNVQLVSDGKPTRIGRKEDKAGKTIRFSKKTGKNID